MTGLEECGKGSVEGRRVPREVKIFVGSLKTYQYVQAILSLSSFSWAALASGVS